MSRALGRYELLRPLARGGMAEVFLACRRAAGVEKWLVVKRIRAERATDVQFLDLFVREARLSMSLAHQNIVPVFDFGRIDDQVFLAMERVEGRDLSSCLARAASIPSPAPLSPLLAAFIAAECCQALDYAHRRKSPEGTPLGIVHRDVTPRNVLLSWSGEVKLTDFGIAALAGDATTALLGTPAYMAPEQARKEALDARTDVYAVGLVLREMLTGQRARAGIDRDSLVGAARAGSLLPWPAHDLPASLVAIVDKATATSAADRHTDARALLAELDEFLVGERAAKRADSPTRQLAAWLDTVWGTERDDDSSTSGEIVADHMVSFLDDGALDVLGTGTQRSLLATAGEDPLVDPLDDTMAASVAKGAAKPTAHGDVAPVDRKPTTIIEPAGTWRWIVLGLAALIAIGAVIFVVTRGHDRSTAVISNDTDGGTANDLDASSRDMALPDAALAMARDASFSTTRDASIEMTRDASVETTRDASIATTRDASVTTARDASITTTRDASITTARDASLATARDAAVTTRDASLALARDAADVSNVRRVTIASNPWSFFRVDDDPTDHESRSTVLLAPGRHVIHFNNPELKLTKDVTIEVASDRDTKVVENLP